MASLDTEPLLLRGPTLESALPDLRVLFLKNNHLRGFFDASALPVGISFVNVASNELEVPSEEIWTSLRSTPGLQVLDLSNNNLTETLFQDLSSLRSLQVLDLTNNALRGDIVVVPSTPGMGENDTRGWPPVLTTLRLGNNQLASSRFVADPTYLGYSNLWNLTTLQSLSLRTNRFKGALPSRLESLRNLKYLELYSNHFTSFPANLSTLTALKYVAFGNNDFQNLPSDTTAWGSLTELWSSRNVFVTRITYPLPPNVFEVHFEGCRLTFIAPGVFDRLSNLQQLHLSDNILTELPSLPRSLNTITLSSNRFRRFPSALQTLPAIATLEISNNRIGGQLEPWLWELRSLEVFIVQGNQALSGVVSENISNLVSLRELNLANNNLTGEWPRAAIAPHNLTDFNLANNSFSGPIPMAYLTRARTSLIQLNLEFNDFSGGLQETLCDFPALQYLLVSNNRLDGTLPSCFFRNDSSTLHDLRTLTLGCQYPSGLQPTEPYQPCPLPFDLSENPSGNRSVVTLIREVSTIARLDLPLPSTNLDGSASTTQGNIDPSNPERDGAKGFIGETGFVASYGIIIFSIAIGMFVVMVGAPPKLKCP